MGALRISKFARTENPRPIRLQDFHVDIVDLVYKYRYLTAPQVAQLLGRNPDAIKKHVRSLYDNKYLLRPRCQRDPAPWHTSHIYHSIASKGAELLRQEKSYTIPLNSYDQKELQDAIKNWKHDITLSQFTVQLAVAIKKHEGVELLFPWDMLERGIINSAAPWHPTRWEHLMWRTTKGVIIPDEAIMFYDHRRPADKNRRLILVEMDMGTEAIERFLKEGCSIANKIEKYIEAYRMKMHTAAYGVQNLRVCFVTTSRQRIKSMISIIEKLGVDQRIFMFATCREVLEAGDPLKFGFLNSQNELTTLL